MISYQKIKRDNDYAEVKIHKHLAKNDDNYVSVPRYGALITGGRNKTINYKTSRRNEDYL